MRQFIVGVIALVGLGACGSGSDMSTASGPGDSAAAGGWVTLFDGSDLSRWTQVGDANWRIVNDYVEADMGTGFLVSDMDYGDFELVLDFWVTTEANSGVFIRCQNPEQITATNAYEVNIYDTRPDQTYRTGSIVEVAPPSSIIHTGGRWNSFRIVAEGSRLQVFLNGTVTVDVEDDQYATGPIGLQYGAGSVMFRNVRIRSL